MTNPSVPQVQVTVQALRWKTGPSGRVHPIVEFSAIEFDQNTIHLASGNHAKYVYEKGLSPGAYVTLSRSNSGTPYVCEVIERKASPPPLESCPSCLEKLIWKEDDLFCPHLDCVARESSLLMRLFEGGPIPPNRNQLLLEGWLEEFPIQKDVFVHIQDIRDFLQHFKQTPPKQSKNRRDLLIEGFGEEEGSLLWELEVFLERKLEKGIPFDQFWYIQNLPCLTLNECQKLKEIDPTNTTLQKLEATGIHPIVLESIAAYQDRWIEIAQFWKFRYPLISG